jgi:uncharacterized protein DUF6629
VCFSPQADLVGGIAIGVIGIDALRHVEGRKDHLALASLPLLLGAHQIDEAFVWWGLQGDAPAAVGRVALWVYLLIAFVVLPIGIPLAVRTFEPDRRRRQLMTMFATIGTIVGAYLFSAIVRGPIEARLAPYHLAYGAPMTHGLVVVTFYVFAVCGALLLSSYRHVAIFGIANLIAVAVLARLTIDGFASIWCAYAAVASAAIAAHMRYARHPDETSRVPHAA